MKFNLALLFAAFNLLGPVHGLTENDRADCDGHPDPHFRNFHGASFDFQSGCDAVLISNNNMQVHGRFVQQGGYSSIDQIGVRIGGTTVVIKGTGSVLYNGVEWDRNPQTFLGYTLESDGAAVVVRFPPLAGETDFGIFVTQGFSQGGDCPGGDCADECINCEEIGGPLTRRRLEDLRGFGNMYFMIKAYGELLSGSSGLCGEWDADGPGFVDPSGNTVDLDPLYPSYPILLDGDDYGESWRVASSPILSPSDAPSPDQWRADMCVPNGARFRDRKLQDGLDLDCPVCYQAIGIVGTLNCLYDATVLGCDEVTNNPLYQVIYTPGTFYGATVNADANLQCTDVADFLDGSSKSSKGKGGRRGDSRKLQGGVDRILRKGNMGKKKKSNGGKTGGKGKSDKGVTECEEMGGECVVYCDVTSTDFECLTGLCDVDLDFGEPIPVLAFDRYYTQCACKIPIVR